MTDHRSSPTLQSIITAIQGRVAALERSGIAATAYTVATLPVATAVKAGTIVFVSDAAPGSRFQGSDGTNWVTLG